MSKKNSKKSTLAADIKGLSPFAALVAVSAEPTVEPTTVEPTTVEPTEPADDDEPRSPGKKLSWREDKVVRLKRNVSKARWFATLVEANAEDAGLSVSQAKLLSEKIADASSTVEACMSEFLRYIDNDFKGRSAPGARVATNGKSHLAGGDNVKLKADAAKAFASFFTSDELGSLTVIDVQAGNAVVQTNTGARIVVAIKKLERDAA
jgi:hypothetical protein